MQYCLIRYKKINISLNFQNNPCYSSSQVPVISTLLNKLNFWLVWPMCLSLDLRDPNVFHLIWPLDLWPVWPLCLSFETFDLCNPVFLTCRASFSMVIFSSTCLWACVCTACLSCSSMLSCSCFFSSSISLILRDRASSLSFLWSSDIFCIFDFAFDNSFCCEKKL